MEINLTPPAAATPLRAWDLYVPVVTTKNAIHAYITEAIDEPSNYNELCYLLDTADSSDVVHLYINTPGGMIDSAFMLLAAIKNSAATTIGHLSGTVASAGTMIALACNKLEVAPHTAFMIHNYSAGLAGKGHEMRARQEFADSSLETAFKDIYGNFLTNKEIKAVIDGKDLWMGRDEVLARFNGTYHAKSDEQASEAATQPSPAPRRRGRPRKA